MNAVYENGYMAFTTEHFSIYVMTAEATAFPSEPECTHTDNDGYFYDCSELPDLSVECECNCHKTGIAKFFAS